MKVIHENQHGIYYHVEREAGVDVVHYKSNDGKKETIWTVRGEEVELERKVGPGMKDMPQRVFNNIPRNVGVRGA